MNKLEYYNYLQDNKGGTIKNGKIVEYKEGYQVATQDSEEIEFNTIGRLLLYVDICELDNFGAWYDRGSWWLDLSSLHIQSKRKALQVARKENQKAIYDWKNKKAIFLRRCEKINAKV